MPLDHDWEKYYLLKEGDVFVELGSGLGEHGGIMSKKVGLSGRVILVEPDKENISRIKENLDDNAILIEKGIWNYSGTCSFTVKPQDNRVVSSEMAERSVEIEVCTLDDMVADLDIDCIDLLAADIECAEVELFGGGMDKCLAQKIVKNVAIAVYHIAGEHLPGPHPPYTKEFHEIETTLRESSYRDIIYESGILYAHL